MIEDHELNSETLLQKITDLINSPPKNRRLADLDGAKFSAKLIIEKIHQD